MTISDVLMILAVLLSPFLAVFAQRILDIQRERRGQRLWIFRTLMSTRGNKLSLEHVQALNSIELFFTDVRKDKEILDKWNQYLDHMNRGPKLGDEELAARAAVWAQTADDLLAGLLQTMGKSLAHNFDVVKIKRGIYIPQGHGDEQYEQLTIRKKMAAILDGKSAFPVRISNDN